MTAVADLARMIRAEALELDVDVVAETDKLTRAEWLELRRSGIGGSDAAAVAGLGRWSTPLSVYLDKTEPDRSNDGASEPMRWGTRLESAICDGFSEETGLATYRCPLMLRCPAHPFMLANVDRFVGTPGERPRAVLEAKNIGRGFDAWLDGVPDYYELQTQHYLAVTGLDLAYVVVLFGGNRLEWFEIHRDEPLIDDLVALEADFWQRVVKRRPPAADGLEPTTEALGRIQARAGAAVELPVDAGRVLVDFAAAKRAVADAEEYRDGLANTLRAWLGDAETGLVDGEPVVTWKPAVRTRLDEKRLTAACPSIPVCLFGLWADLSPLAGFRTTTTYRTLRPKGR